MIKSVKTTIYRVLNDCYNVLENNDNGFSLRRIITIYFTIITGLKLYQTDEIVKNWIILTTVLVFILLLIGLIMFDQIATLIKDIKEIKKDE